MSTREMKRWAVMRRVRDRALSLGDAAVLLDLSYRQVRRIYQRFRARGHKGLVHGHVGRRSNHAHPPAVRARAVALITEHFSGTVRGRGQRFGPTLATEHLTEEFGPKPTVVSSSPFRRRSALGASSPSSPATRCRARAAPSLAIRRSCATGCSPLRLNTRLTSCSW